MSQSSESFQETHMNPNMTQSPQNMMDIGQNINLNQLDGRLRELRDNRISNSSRTVYVNAILRFLTWICFNNRNLFTDELNQLITEEVPRFQTATELELSNNEHKKIRNVLNSFLKQDQVHPIKFTELEAKAYMQYIVSLRKGDSDELLAKNTYGTHRSALFNLFEIYHVEYESTKLAKEIKVYFRGLKREISQRIQNGEGSIKVGKDPLPFGLYRFLAKEFLNQSGTECTSRKLY